jgi:pimeloyl-ACP methyl ester carboxylesterase
MKKDLYKKFYKNVSEEKIEKLRRFRSTHQYEHITVDGVPWKYIFCGQGNETLLLLTGSTGFSEDFFMHIIVLENEHQIICPSYPTVKTMEQLLDGIMKILKLKNIQKINVLGVSFGGILAQVIVHKYPEIVNKMILSHTTTTSPPVDKAIIFEKGKMIEKLLKILPFLPIWLFRFMYKKQIIKLADTMEFEEKKFLNAYLNERIFYITKENQISLYKCMVDFGQNYTFSTDDLVNWSGKILILESDNDQIFHQSERDAVRKLYPQAYVHTFKGSGHLTMIVKREEFISVVRNFLKEK